VYTDKLHQGKEEALLFPALVKRGVPPGGCPIGGMNHEHEKGRALVQVLAEQAPVYGQNKPGAKDALLETLRGILDLYQNHIWKEDAMVFPMADKVLTPADQKELSREFAEVDRAVGLDAIERLEQFARSLSTSATSSSTSGAASAGGCGHCRDHVSVDNRTSLARRAGAGRPGSIAHRTPHATVGPRYSHTAQSGRE
jgi:hemerythrin-like domain-containing protein